MRLYILQVFIITGGNIGVGFQLAKILYGANADIYLAGRSEKRVTEAIQFLCAELPDSKGNLAWLPLDLADLGSIKLAAEQFCSKEKRLDVLWNNAGVMFPPGAAKTEQVSYSIMFSVADNRIGQLTICSLMLPTPPYRDMTFR